MLFTQGNIAHFPNLGKSSSREIIHKGLHAWLVDESTVLNCVAVVVLNVAPSDQDGGRCAEVDSVKLCGGGCVKDGAVRPRWRALCGGRQW